MKTTLGCRCKVEFSFKALRKSNLSSGLTCSKQTSHTDSVVCLQSCGLPSAVSCTRESGISPGHAIRMTRKRLRGPSPQQSETWGLSH